MRQRSFFFFPFLPLSFFFALILHFLTTAWNSFDPGPRAGLSRSRKCGGRRHQVIEDWRRLFFFSFFPPPPPPPPNFTAYSLRSCGTCLNDVVVDRLLRGTLLGQSILRAA